jgi:hypothetical protein
MEANELRIGNLTYRIEVNNKNNTVIDDITIYDMERIQESQTKTFIYEPIKLDEEWFLKCKSNSIFNNGFEYKKTSTGRFEIYVGMSLITVIEFVHELQNLNFALLGEDVVFENV